MAFSILTSPPSTEVFTGLRPNVESDISPFALPCFDASIGSLAKRPHCEAGIPEADGVHPAHKPSLPTPLTVAAPRQSRSFG